MRISDRCVPCLVNRAYMELRRATDDIAVRMEALKEVLKLIASNIHKNTTPSAIGTLRDRLIKKITGNPDPYWKLREESNELMMELYGRLEEVVRSKPSQYARFREACLLSIAANMIEFDVLGRDFSLEDVEGQVLLAPRTLAIDHLRELYSCVKEGNNVLFLADNAGEIVADKLLVRELKEMGKYIVFAVKEKPVLNDAVMEDARFVGIDEVVDELVATGADTVGLILEECSRSFLRKYEDADLVIAKGMGHIETLTEYELTRDHAFLLHTKCEPVSEFLGVEVGENVALLVKVDEDPHLRTSVEKS